MYDTLLDDNKIFVLRVTVQYIALSKALSIAVTITIILPNLPPTPIFGTLSNLSQTLLGPSVLSLDLYYVYAEYALLRNLVGVVAILVARCSRASKC
jgi:hypothetical protein